MFLSLLTFTLSTVVLSRSSIFLVRVLKRISYLFKISEFVAAFVLMGIATSLPELMVGIVSAIEEVPTITLGNVIGSNIVNVTLVMGLTALAAKGIKINSKKHKMDIILLNTFALLPLVLLLDKTLSKTDGLVLIASYVIYIVILYINDGTKNLGVYKEKTRSKKLNEIGKLLLGVAVLLVSADLAVKSASKIAVELNLPLLVIGLFIVAIGTSLPELFFEITSVFNKETDMALGNIVGSVVINSTLILGISSVITPIKVSAVRATTLSGYYLILSLILFSLQVKTGGRLSWVEGIMLVLFYILFVSAQLIIR